MEEALKTYLHQVERELSHLEPPRRAQVMRELEAQLLEELETFGGQSDLLAERLAQREDPRSLGRALAHSHAVTFHHLFVSSLAGALVMSLGAGIYFVLKGLISWRVGLIFGLAQGGGVGLPLLWFRSHWQGWKSWPRHLTAMAVGGLAALPWAVLFGRRAHWEMIPYGAFLGWLTERVEGGLPWWGWVRDNVVFTLLMAVWDWVLYPAEHQSASDVLGLGVFHACLQAGAAGAMALRRHLRDQWVLGEKEP
ncbi:MAG TPA: hypothetical protein VJ570_13440 [Holophagaceae bacterium]|nr:hypothetical protein [Holophagaceae bacterium]